MNAAKHWSSDLDYVGGLLRKSQRGTSPYLMYLLWAVLVLVGFSLVDLAPRWVGTFWIFAGPLGGLASAILGYRYGRQIGQVSRREGILHLLHWLGLMAAIALAVPLGVTGVVEWRILSRIFLLIIALAYYLAGVHLERPLIFAGLVMMLGYVGLYFIPAYGWTLTGILVAGSLVLSGYLETRGGAPASR